MKRVYMTSALGNMIKQWSEMVDAGRMSVENYNHNIQTIQELIESTQQMLLKTEPGPFRAQVVYGLIEKALDNSKKDAKFWSQVSCRAGCSHCCHMTVEITTDETELLAQLIESGKVQIDFSKLERQASLPADADKWWTQPRDERACVFLGEDNKCKVYENRPVSCRKYHVFTKPELCGTATLNTQVGVVVDNFVEAFASAATDLDQESWNKNLPQMLLARLKKKLKP